MSPRSRGRPPGRGRRRQPGRKITSDCWFDEPGPADRRSWAVPPGHGTYRGLNLELLNPDDDDELMFLIEALHEEFHDALDSGEDMTVGGEPVNPRLHVTMHQVVARQILADDPPATWQTAQRLTGLGYDWHNIMHMIASLVVEDVHAVMAENRKPDPAGYARRLDQLPGDWPLPGTPR